MNIRVLEAGNERVRILFENVPLPLVNAIRRSCFINVPVMAVDYVEFYDNNTVLYDEIIAHRIGLIPLRSKEALERYREPEYCEKAEPGDPNCYATLRLEVMTENEQRIVYSGDLEPEDPFVEPVYKNIPIVVMAPGQRLILKAFARLGYGRDHAKWMPVTIAAHKYLPVLRVQGSIGKECMDCLAQTAPGIAERVAKLPGGGGEVEILDDINTSGIYWCVRNRCRDSPIELVYDEKRLLLTVESAGQLPAGLIVLKAIEALKKKLNKILGEAGEAARA